LFRDRIPVILETKKKRTEKQVLFFYVFGAETNSDLQKEVNEEG